MLIRNIPTYLILVALFLLAQACASSPVKNVFEPRYLTDERHYTFAIYNSDNLLITHPYEDWKRAYLQAEKEGEPYTDLYIVSHGWNFTHQEAMSNYYRYIQMVDYFLPKSGTIKVPTSPEQTHRTSKVCPKKHFVPETNRCKFKPHFIFVVWNSTSRPLSESSHSIFPFGIEDTLSELLRFVDMAAFHIPSTWKQSINASRNAIGKGHPYEYFNPINFRENDGNAENIQNLFQEFSNSVGPLQSKHYFYNCSPYANRKHLLFLKEHLAGRAMPLAVILAQIIQPNKESYLKRKIIEKLNQIDTKINNLKNKIENATWSTRFLQSLRYFLLFQSTDKDKLEYFKSEKSHTEEFKNLLKETYFKNLLETCQDSHPHYQPKNLKIHLVGHSFGAKLISLSGLHGLDLTQPSPEQPDTSINQQPALNPEITSLILFNPAFNADELTSTANPYPIFKTIPQKVIIYSNTDYATGLLFETSQKVINSTVSQQVDRDLYDIFEIFRNRAEKASYNLDTPLKLTIESVKAGEGFYALAFTFAASPLIWLQKTYLTIWDDFTYHYHNHRQGRVKLLNAAHFFIPLEKLYPLNNLKGSNLDADQYGIWRGVDTGLGRSGLHNFAKGRQLTNEHDRSGTTIFQFTKIDDSESKLSNHDTATLFARVSCFPKVITNSDLISRQFALSNIEKDNKTCFYERALQEIEKGEKLAPLLNDLSWLNSPEEFFSIDGSSIYDTAGWPFIGSHGDLRDAGRSSACQDLFKILQPELQDRMRKRYRNIETDMDEGNASKRHATFNFIIKSTQGELVEMESTNRP